jgi:DNA-binding response OmpR family regulator
MPQSIMLVDDDNDLRTLMAMILKRSGYTVQQAEDAHQALEQLNISTPDLFLLDVMMPEIDGFELTQRLRAMPETAEHPILLLSARTDPLIQKKGLESGANRYLTKPIPTNELVSTIREYLGENV